MIFLAIPVVSAKLLLSPRLSPGPPSPSSPLFFLLDLLPSLPQCLFCLFSALYTQLLYCSHRPSSLILSVSSSLCTLFFLDLHNGLMASLLLLFIVNVWRDVPHEFITPTSLYNYTSGFTTGHHSAIQQALESVSQQCQVSAMLIRIKRSFAQFASLWGDSFKLDPFKKPKTEMFWRCIHMCSLFPQYQIQNPPPHQLFNRGNNNSFRGGRGDKETEVEDLNNDQDQFLQFLQFEQHEDDEPLKSGYSWSNQMRMPIRIIVSNIVFILFMIILSVGIYRHLHQ